MRVRASVRVDRPADHVGAWFHAFIPRRFPLRLVLRAGSVRDDVVAAESTIALHVQRAPGGAQAAWEPIGAAATGTFSGFLTHEATARGVILTLDGSWDGAAAPHVAHTIAYDVLRHVRERVCGVPAEQSAV